MEYRFYYPDFRIHKEHTLKSKELNKIYNAPFPFGLEGHEIQSSLMDIHILDYIYNDIAPLFDNN